MIRYLLVNVKAPNFYTLTIIPWISMKFPEMYRIFTKE